MSFSIQPESIAEADKSRRKIFIIVAVVTLPVLAAIVYFALSRPANNSPAQLAGALRAGSPEFEQARQNIIVDFKGDESDDAVESPRPLGDIVMTLTPTIRNFTGRTITGLELRGVVRNLQGKIVRERTVIAIPARQSELENNKTLKVPIIIEGFKKEDERANVKVEVTGVKFK